MRSTRGFTLIEVVVATAILASALVAALATYGSELRALARARDVAIAVDLAEDRLAAIELHALRGLPSLPDSLEGGVFPEPFSSFRWHADARQRSEGLLAEVIVSVTWRDGMHEIIAVLPLPALRRSIP